MGRGELFNLGEVLAENWVRGATVEVLEQILSRPPAEAAALAVIVSKNLDDVFNEGPGFRSALAERATA